MALTNKLKSQVDLPVFEMLRPAPAVSAATSCSCYADNANFHVQHGRYIYYMIGSTAFYRYDTWTDTYIQLSSPPLTLLTWSSMRFAGSKGYEGRIISSPTTTTLQMAMPFASVGKTFDIKITDGTGKGQQRIITDVATPVIADYGSATTGAVTSLTDTNKSWQINQWVGYQVRIISGTGTGQVRKILYNGTNSLTISDAAKYPEDINCNVQWVAPAAGSIYHIESSIVTVDSALSPQPDATSRFLVESGGIYLTTSLATSFYAIAYYDILTDTWYIRTASSTIISATGTDGTLERCTENASIWDRGVASTGGSSTTLVDTTKNWSTNQWAGYYVRIFSGTGEGLLRPISSNTNTTLTWVTTGATADITSKYLIVGFDAGTCSGNSVSESANSASVTASAYGNVLTVTAVGSGALIQGQILKGTGLGAVLAFNNGTSSGAVVTLTSGNTNLIQVGMVMVMISGTGALIASTVATVINVLTPTTFTISQTPTTPLSGTNVFMLGGGLGGQTAYTSGGGSGSGTTITVTSTTNLQVGMSPYVSTGTGTFYPGTVVTAILTSTTFTVDVAPSVGLSAATVVACFPIPVILGSQITGTPGSTGTYNIYPLQPVVASTTVNANGIAVLVDSSKSTWSVNRWNNLAVRITSGTGKGQVRAIQTTIPGYLSVSPDWTTSLDNTSTYEIQGDPDKLYLMLGGNSSMYVQNIAADVMTTGRLEAYGTVAGCFAQYADHPPIAISSGSYAGSTMTITTVNSHNFKIGQVVNIYGDTGAGKSLNNTTQTIVNVAAANTFTFTVVGSASITVPAQSTSTLVDSTKNWVIDQWAGCIVTYTNAVPTQASGLATVFSELIIGNSTTTLFFARVGTAPVQGISRYVITQNHMAPSKSAIGALDSGISVYNNDTTAILGDQLKGFTSIASSCSSSGTTVTTTGNLKGLSVGMYVIVTAGTGTMDALTMVTSLISDTQFTVNKTPLVALVTATVQGTFWVAGQHNGRRARIIAGVGMFQEFALNGSTFQTLTMGAITTSPANGTSVYEIIPIPARSLGLEMNWIFGQTDLNKKGSLMYMPRGASTQMDRLNMQTDTWEIVQMIPQVESLTTGTQWAYDGVNKIYIIVNGTLRMLYLDVNTNIVHGGMMLPYIVGTAIIGNRTEIIETIDGLQYLWTNRQSNVEMFRSLIFW